jgi:exopolyphosphatase/pppGpp-phosphohydrolase
LKSLGYVVNQVTAEQEGQLALKSVLPAEYTDKAFVVDIGSGNTKISWVKDGKVSALESYGAKYFQDGSDDAKVYQEVSAKPNRSLLT